MQINLLAPQTTFRRQIDQGNSTKWISIVGGALVVSVLLVAATTLVLESQVSKQLIATNKEISSMQNVAKESEIRNQLQLAINQKIEQYKGINDQRPIWTNRIAELSSLVPQNVILTAIEFNNSGKWTIEGVAPGNDQVAQFTARLQGSGYFAKAYINQISAASQSSGINFNINIMTQGGAQR